MNKEISRYMGNNNNKNRQLFSALDWSEKSMSLGMPSDYNTIITMNENNLYSYSLLNLQQGWNTCVSIMVESEYWIRFYSYFLSV